MKFIDMHTHTTASDGVFSPSRLIDYAIEKGLSGIAITDHDTVGGIDEAIKQANKYKDFIVIPGVELSTEYNNEEVHILGYMIDYKMKYLLKILQDLQSTRKNRAIKIVDKLKKAGLDINYGDIFEIANNDVIGRPHIARFLVQKGYVQTIEEAFTKYLVEGALAYVPKQKLTPIYAINIIKKSKGIAVIAHPGLLKDPITVLKHLIDIGIDGIEVYHSEHTIEQSKEYFKLAKVHNLFITGGSDFHYPPGNNRNNVDLGSVKVSLKSIKKVLK